MDDITQKYDAEFFDYTLSSELGSSLDVARVLIKYYNPQSVIDIGCGCGIYIKAFTDLGIMEVIGYDGSKNAVAKSLLPDKTLISDLRKPLPTKSKYDLCICIEVAEHIEYEYSRQLVETLTSVSDTVFFTAAPPGQGGLHHVNEKPNEFWIELFNKYNFQKDDLTDIIRGEMAEKSVVYWIVNNLIIFRKRPL